MIASFLVAVAAFWWPVNVLSLCFAFASFCLEFSNERGPSMNKECMTVGRGLTGK